MCAISWVLQEQTDRVCLGEIAQLLTATEPAIRMMACVALSRVGLRNPYRALQQLIENDPSQHVGKYAADAIQEMLKSCSAEQISAWLKYEDEAHTQISITKIILSKRFGLFREIMPELMADLSLRRVLGEAERALRKAAPGET